MRSIAAHNQPSTDGKYSSRPIASHVPLFAPKRSNVRKPHRRAEAMLSLCYTTRFSFAFPHKAERLHKPLNDTLLVKGAQKQYKQTNKQTNKQTVQSPFQSKMKLASLIILTLLFLAGSTEADDICNACNRNCDFWNWRCRYRKWKCFAQGALLESWKRTTELACKPGNPSIDYWQKSLDAQGILIDRKISDRDELDSIKWEICYVSSVPIFKVGGFTPSKGKVWINWKTMDSKDEVGLAELYAHELHHIRQHRDWGTGTFNCKYSIELAHDNGWELDNKVEEEAYLFQWSVAPCIEDKTVCPLQSFHAGCTKQDITNSRSPDCVSAMHGFCSHAYTKDHAGISQEVPQDAFTVACFHADFYRAPLSELPNCKFDDSQHGDCVADTQNWCRNNGHGDLGLVQEIPDPTVFDVACFWSNWYGDMSISILSSYVAGCNRPHKSQTNDCVAAIHRWCNAQGYDAGIAQQRAPGVIGVGCFMTRWIGDKGLEFS